jgi:ubiquinone/menaquinone biosynthesis C-methylase UbiE
MPVKSGAFDLVFNYATLEHVPGIRQAFREMVRATALSGFYL